MRCYPHLTLCLPDVYQPVKPVSSQPVNVTIIVKIKNHNDNKNKNHNDNNNNVCQAVNMTCMKRSSTIWKCMRKVPEKCMMTYLQGLHADVYKLIVESVLADGTYDTVSGQLSYMCFQLGGEQQLTIIHHCTRSSSQCRCAVAGHILGISAVRLMDRNASLCVINCSRILFPPKMVSKTAPQAESGCLHLCYTTV